MTNKEKNVFNLLNRKNINYKIYCLSIGERNSKKGFLLFLMKQKFILEI